MLLGAEEGHLMVFATQTLQLCLPAWEREYEKGKASAGGDECHANSVEGK